MKKHVFGCSSKLNELGKGKLHLISYDMPTLATVLKNIHAVVNLFFVLVSLTMGLRWAGRVVAFPYHKGYW